MKKILSLFCLIILISGNQIAFSQWSSNWKWSMGNPTGDDIRFIKTISANEWIGLGFNGGLIKTTNAGLNWTSRSDVSNYTGYNPPHIRDGWFFDSNNGFAVGDQDQNGLITRTTNGGQTWTKTIFAPTTFSAIYFLNNNTGYVVGSYFPSAYKTTNGGLNWTAMAIDAVDQMQDIFALDANNVYAVGGKNLYKSTDGGTTWTHSETSVPYASHFSVYFKDVNTGFVAGDAGKFQITTDGGTTWETRSAPATENIMKEIQFNDPEILLVGDENNVYRTTDYGITWSSLNFSSSAPSGNITNSMYSLDRFGSTIVISGFTGLIYSSSDNGNTWATLSTVKIKGYLQGLYASTMNGKIWAVGDAAPSSILYSPNGGSTWQTNFGSAGNTNYRDVEFLNDNTGYICGEGGTIIRTSNGGTSWSSIPTGTIQAANTIEIVDNNVVLVGCNAGKLFRSTNAGLNFTELQIGTSTFQFNAISFPDQNTGWSTMSRSILKSTDKGATWSTQFTHTTTLLSICMIDVNKGFACGYSGSLFKTTNGGINWNQLASPIPNNLTKVDFVNANYGFVVSGGGLGAPGVAMKTTNAGVSWQIVNAGSNQLFNVKVLHPDSAIAVGYSNIIKYMAPSNDFKLSLALNFELCPNLDTVTVEIRSSVSPYNLIESKKGLGGKGVPMLFNFSTVTNGTPYFISVKNRNAITTWTSVPVSFTGNALSYDFTSAASQAYGSNMKQAAGLWSYYQGDINQDEDINLADILLVYNDASNYVSGPYVLTDLNCDGFTDLSDIIATSNNSSNFISVKKP